MSQGFSKIFCYILQKKQKTTDSAMRHVDAVYGRFPLLPCKINTLYTVGDRNIFWHASSINIYRWTWDRSYCTNKSEFILFKLSRD